jgi:Flp pilus assembly protein TadD
MVLFDLGQCQEALAGLDAAIACNPQDHVALANRGLIYLRMNRLDEAERDSAAAIEIMPSMATAYLNLALSQEGGGKVSQAIGTLEALASLRPQRVSTLDRARSVSEQESDHPWPEIYERGSRLYRRLTGRNWEVSWDP